MPETAAGLAGALAAGRLRKRLPPPVIRRLLRESNYLALRHIAAACDVDVATISRWEAGLRTPRGEYLKRYIAVLDQLAREQGQS